LFRDFGYPQTQAFLFVLNAARPGSLSTSEIPKEPKGDIPMPFPSLSWLSHLSRFRDETPFPTRPSKNNSQNETPATPVLSVNRA